MKGSHRVIVETKKVKYDFTVKRNITILTGDSGSGKTVLIDMIREYRRYGSDSGVFLSCDCECRTIDDENWMRQIEEISGSIIFIDEGNRFLPSKEFAELVLKSDNYFVLAVREKLPRCKSSYFSATARTLPKVTKCSPPITSGILPSFTI